MWVVREPYVDQSSQVETYIIPNDNVVGLLWSLFLWGDEDIECIKEVSSENFYMWHDSVLYLKSEVYRVNRTGESTVPCGAPVLLTTVSERQSFSLTNCGLPVR
ncbi:unnamed protein product [Merluccius merluccius]